jgi:tetratricopeptide (TPR) repeat protein
MLAPRAAGKLVTGRGSVVRTPRTVAGLAAALLLVLSVVAFAQEPSGAEADWRAGLEAEQAQDWDGAIDLYSRAIESGELSQRELARVFRSRGNVRHTMGEDSEALQDYETSLRLDPDYANAWISRGVIYHLRGQFPKAVDDYDKAIELEPDNALAYANRGGALEQLGQVEDAIADFRTAYRLGFDAGWLVDVLSEYGALPEGER